MGENKENIPVLYEFIALAKQIHTEGRWFKPNQVSQIEGKLSSALQSRCPTANYTDTSEGGDPSVALTDLLRELRTDARKIRWSFFDDTDELVWMTRCCLRGDDFYEGTLSRLAAIEGANGNRNGKECFHCLPNTIMITIKRTDGRKPFKDDVCDNISLRKLPNGCRTPGYYPRPDKQSGNREYYRVAPRRSAAKPGDVKYTVKTINLSSGSGSTSNHTWVLCRDTSVPLNASANWAGSTMPSGKRAAWYKIYCMGSSPVEPISIRAVKQMCRDATFTARVVYERV